MGLVSGPTAYMDHQLSVTSQAWGGDPQQPERRPLDQTKYDAFMTWAYYRQLITQTTWVYLIPYYWNQSRFWAAEI